MNSGKVVVWANEIRRKAEYIRDYVHDEIRGTPQDPPDTRAPQAGQVPAPSLAEECFLIVGKGQAVPGNSASIEILGRCPHPTGGFGITFGMDSHPILESHEVTEEARALFPGLEFVPYTMVSQGRGRRPQNQLIAAFFGFFSKLTEADIGENISNKTAPTYVRIPNLIPLLRLTIKVPTDAPQDQRYELDNRSYYYGREFKDANGQARTLKQKTVFTTAHKDQVFPHGIEPQLVGGWIDVVSTP